MLIGQIIKFSGKINMLNPIWIEIRPNAAGRETSDSPQANFLVDGSGHSELPYAPYRILYSSLRLPVTTTACRAHYFSVFVSCRPLFRCLTIVTFDRMASSLMLGSSYLVSTNNFLHYASASYTDGIEQRYELSYEAHISQSAGP